MFSLIKRWETASNKYQITVGSPFPYKRDATMEKREVLNVVGNRTGMFAAKVDATVIYVWDMDCVSHSLFFPEIFRS